MTHARVRIGRFVRHHMVSVRALIGVAAATALLVLVSGVAITYTDPSRFDGAFEGWWWAASTATTVGYGDVVPASVAGRLIGLALMFSGVAMLAILTASIAALLMSGDVEEEERHIEQRLDDIERQLTRVLAALEDVQEQPGGSPDTPRTRGWRAV